jgi:hypothetical protein
MTPEQQNEFHRLQAIWRKTPFAEREREFWMVVICTVEDKAGPLGTVGDAFHPDVFETLLECFHLKVDGFGEVYDALN